MKLHRNQKGMGVVEILLILVVVGILGFTGWFVWQSQKNTTNSLNDANKSQTPTQVTKTDIKDTTSSTDNEDTSTKYLDIKEWGVKLPQGNLDGLEYTLKNDDTLLLRAAFMKSLCEDSTSNTVVVQRGKAADLVDGDTMSGPPFEKYVGENPQYLYVKLGDYYYVQPAYRGGSCAVDSINSDKELSEISKIKALLTQMVNN